MGKFTKQQIRDYIKFEKAFGKCSWSGIRQDESTTELYKRYKRIFA